NLLKREFLNQTVYPRIEIDSLMVDSFYFAREDLFTYESQVNVGHIVLSKPGYRHGDDSAAYAPYSDHELDSMIYFRLNLLKSEISDSLDFEHLAKLYSLDGRTGGLGGRFGWVQKNNLHPEIERVLYDPQTPLHTVIGPLESRDGVHLFYLYDRHFQGIPPLNPERYDRARGILLNVFAQGEIATVLDSLRAVRPTIYNDSALQLGSREGEPSLWVAWAEGIDTVRFAEYDNACIPFRSRFNTLTFTAEQGRYIVQTIVDERLLIMLAEELGIPQQPAVSEELEKNRRKFARVAVRRLGEAPGFVPSDEHIRDYFDTHEREFVSERPVKLQQILLADSLHAEFVKALAESGEDFLTLAERHYVGEPDIRRAAADLGWIGPRDFDSTIFEESYAAIDGSVLGPIKTEYGYHVVRVEEVKRAPSLEEVRGRIYTELALQERGRVHSAW
ncbi:MAG TPA: peptidylprolyl isomerase, partial [candidate division Zixibacteria bacterium]|nr:peptidylprolyl isomerase [candidate division Zixibacteria bacterium]